MATADSSWRMLMVEIEVKVKKNEKEERKNNDSIGEVVFSSCVTYRYYIKIINGTI